MIDIIKKIGIAAGIVAIAAILGKATNEVIPWEYLTQIFTIIRWFLNMMDWAIPVATMFWAIGLSLTLEGFEIAFDAGMIPIHWFHKSA